jgi:hypothetical protein
MKTKKAYFWVVVGLCLCLIGSIGASIVQSDGGNVIVKELTWESAEGYILSGIMYKPKTASKGSKVPAVVTVEGWYNTKEMQDLYSIELARRGYAVLALDMHGHGNSEAVTADQLYDGAVGVDSAVIQVASWDFVDTSRIGVTGHSSGGTAANMAVAIDNERETPLIKAVLQQAGDWQDDTGADHSGDYKWRDVGIIASTHDDFYFGTYDDNGNMLTTPAQFLETDGAKKFLNFNEKGFSGEAKANSFYTKNIDGITAHRIIYRPNCIHPMVPYSTECVAYAMNFFDTTLGSPVEFSDSNQIWPVKAVFNAIGMAGFLIFLFSFALQLVELKPFSSLVTSEQIPVTQVTGGKGKIWFWISLAITAIFSAGSLIWCMNHIYSISTAWFPQTATLTLGSWSAISAAFGIVMILIGLAVTRSRKDFSGHRVGLTISLPQLGKTIVVSISAVFAAYVLVFLSNFLFETDFRWYTVAIAKTFTNDKLALILRYLPFYLVFYIVSSISVNCFNNNGIGGKLNTLILAIANALGAIFIVVSQYVYFYTTSRQLYGLSEGQRIMPIWCFPVIFMLFGSVFTSRLIYKKTKNPYLGGMINALFVTIMSVTNTYTCLGGAHQIFTTF